MSSALRYGKLVTELPDGGPLAYWRKMNNGTIEDVVGTRHLTVSGAAAKVAGLPANSDEGIDLAGVASAARASDAGLQVAAFSLSMWFMPNTLDSGETPEVLPLLTKNAADNVAGDLQVLYSEDGFVRIRFQDGTASHTIESPIGSVRANTSHHLCVRGDATGFDAYLDGRYLGKNTKWTGALSENTQDLLLGANAANPELFPDAVVDEIALFARVVTEAEVIALAQASAAPEARPDEISVPEDDDTPIDVLANDKYVGAKADLEVKLLDRPGGGDKVDVDRDNNVVYKAKPVSENTTRSFTYQIRDANGVSNPATVSVTVEKAAAPETDDPATAELPFFGQYYGGGWPSGQNGEYRLTSPPHTFFFYAERTGEVEGFQWSWRTEVGDDSYSQGDGGEYLFEIIPADPKSKREASGASAVCSRRGIQPGNTTTGSRFVEYDFTKKGQLKAGKPYCLKVTNTHANPGGNYASQNVTRYFVWHSQKGTNFIEPGGGPGQGKIHAAKGGIPGHAVGRSIARIRGYAPHMIEDPDGDFLLYPVPIGSEGADLKHRRCGGIHCSLRYKAPPGSTRPIYTNWGRGSGNIKEDTLVIKGKTQLRQRFCVARANRTVSGVFIMGWVNGKDGKLNVILESGPDTDAHFPGNGVPMEAPVEVPAEMFLNAGPELIHNQFQKKADDGPLALAHYVWVPFARGPHTLERGKTYNLRLVPSGCDFRMVGGARGDTEYGMLGREAATWKSWERNRKVSWTTFEDSRGPQLSTDGGDSWAYLPGNAQQVPITFKCV